MVNKIIAKHHQITSARISDVFRHLRSTVYFRTGVRENNEKKDKWSLDLDL